MAARDKASVEWAVLLAKAAKGAGADDRVLALVSGQVADFKSAMAEFFAGAEDALAAIAALRGSADCKIFATSVAPAFAAVGRKLMLLPASVDNNSLVSLLCLSSMAESVGATLALPKLDLAAKFRGLAVDRWF